MNILKEYPAMDGILNRVAQGLGYPAFQRSLLSNLRFCDFLLRDIQADAAVPPHVRTTVYTTLMSPGPGGLQAFAWLLKSSQVSPELLHNYLHCLPGGSPSTDALDEKQALEIGRVILESPLIPDERRLESTCRVLACQAVSRQARVALFKTLLNTSWHEPEMALALCRWATESCSELLPAPPEELYRPALQGLVTLGQEPHQLARTAMLNQPLAISVADGLLDLLEYFASAFDRDERSAILDATRQHGDPKVRRRAYQLAELSEGESFLRLGLRDLDSGVRNWVLARVSQRRSA